MGLFDRPLRERPFKKLVLARRLRKMAYYQHTKGQMTEADYDQFCAKTRDGKTLNEICDHLESAKDEYGAINWQDWWSWLRENWPSILKFILTFAPLLLDRPNVGYDMGPKRPTSRKRPPSYQDDEEYQKDREETLRELDARSD